MSIELRIGCNQEQKVYKGIQNVLEYAPNDRYVSVKLRDGKFACGGKKMIVPFERLSELGFRDSSWPFTHYVVMHSTPETRDKDSLQSEYTIIPWIQVDHIFMYEKSAFDTFDELFEHFQER